MHQIILLPTDGTLGTKEVAERAFDLAIKYDATIQALNAIIDVHPESSGGLEEHTLGIDMGTLRAA
jgi:nucleotide-binding universal stress UspA family protein